MSNKNITLSVIAAISPVLFLVFAGLKIAILAAAIGFLVICVPIAVEYLRKGSSSKNNLG